MSAPLPQTGKQKLCSLPSRLLLDDLLDFPFSLREGQAGIHLCSEDQAVGRPWGLPAFWSDPVPKALPRTERNSPLQLEERQL